MRPGKAKHLLKKRLLASPKIVASVYLLAGFPALAQTATNQPPFQLTVTSNVVVVRVVVRDAQGKPVGNLRKDDFEILDRGQPQPITQFSVANGWETPPSTLGTTKATTDSAVAPALAQRFLAFYFDDLNISDANLIQAREAADSWIKTNMQATDRLGIFTTAKMVSDFTNDPKQIHDALFSLRASPLSLREANKQDCPELTDYQAQQILDYEWNENIDAWKIALDQAKNDARCLRVSVQPGAAQREIVMLARKMVDQGQMLVRADLQALGQVEKYLAQMPGQRTLVMVSPGFLSRSEQSQLDTIVDHAIRDQVTVHALDPKGLTNRTREGDVSHSYLPATGEALGLTQGMDSERESIASDVLAQLAEGTGGAFVHDNNDLAFGLTALTESPSYYLSFDPKDLKPDGRFHELKVQLAQKHTGFQIQARRGYFAPANKAEMLSTAKPGNASDPDAQAQEQIRESIRSKTDLQQLPVTMEASVSTGKTGLRTLALSTHLDATSLHFHKDGQHNLNDLTFVFAVFDAKDNVVQVQRGQAKLDILDADLQKSMRAGVRMDSTFDLKPGTYRVREIVTDSEEHRMTAFSRAVDVSADCCVKPVDPHQVVAAAGSPASPAGRSLPPLPSQPPTPDTHAEKLTFLDYPLRKLQSLVPALNGIKGDPSQGQLASILTRAGEATLRSLSAAPNLTCREDVYSVRTARGAGQANSILGLQEAAELLDLEHSLRQSRGVEFNYLLLFDHHQDGATAIRELRTDFKNRQIDSSTNAAGPSGFGFAYQWLLLSPANQPELRFRYLGQQSIDDHDTFVVSFSQIPDRVKEPGQFSWAGQQASFFFQGIVWIDRKTSAVVRLHTELLAPIPGLNLSQMTTELHFRSVHIHGLDAVLWLPSEVFILAEQNEIRVEELHDYAGYKFFHAESKLLP